MGIMSSGGWHFRNRPSPEKEAYKPGLIRGDGPDEPVPEKHRHLRLRRRRTARMTRTPLIIHLAIVVAIVGFVVIAYRVFHAPAG